MTSYANCHTDHAFTHCITIPYNAECFICRKLHTTTGIVNSTNHLEYSSVHKKHYIQKIDADICQRSKN